MMKTPISILQELAVQKKLPLPDYETSGSGQSHTMSFVCNVKLGNEKAIGRGSTKKDAKHDAASKMLAVFGVNMNMNLTSNNMCLLPSKTRRDAPTINFVGKLNEFCSGNRFPQPSYIDGSSSTLTAQFCIICKFLEFSTEGNGCTKKDAKQDSAKKMIVLVKEKDLGYIQSHILQDSQLNEQEEESNTEKVLQKYTDIMKNLSISSPTPTSSNYNNNIELPKKLVNILNWEELIDYMTGNGWRHEVTVFQRAPLILSLKINDHTLMNFGHSREEIQQKFVSNVVQMLEEGTNFNEPLING